MSRLLIAVVSLLLYAAPAVAQTRVLAWDMVGVSGATASTFVYAVTDNGQPVPSAPITCTGSTNATCKRPFTLTPGEHRLVVTVGGNGTSITSDAFTTQDPVKPTNLRLELLVAVKADGTAELLAMHVEKLP
jgi:hypothetical protein